jgi:hypothetical protein
MGCCRNNGDEEIYVRTDYYEETIIDKLYNWYVRNRDKNIDYV